MEALLRYERSADDGGADPAALRAIQRESRSTLAQLLAAPGGTPARSGAPGRAHHPQMEDPVDTSLCGLLLSFAYPDRIGQRRGEGAFLLSGGRGAALAPGQLMERSPYIVAASVDDQGTQSRIMLAAEVTEELLLKYHSGSITEESGVYWDAGSSSVKARTRTMLGSLVLKETSHNRPTDEEAAEVLLGVIASEGLEVLPWEKGNTQLRQRMIFMHSLRQDWPDVSTEALTTSLSDWLGPYLQGMRSLRDLSRIPLTRALVGMLNWSQRQTLDQEAPTHITVPSGSRIPVDYENPSAPVLAVRLQEMFGLSDTPRLGGGRIPALLHLLSPARRPIQVTSDLASFWRSTYFEVKKDLKGRYPKHYWPDDPMQAVPTNRVRPSNK